MEEKTNNPKKRKNKKQLSSPKKIVDVMCLKEARQLGFK
jgi:hypothetical protein